jgi:hydrogenase nickel incorporation protein HypA/HybF
MHELSIALSIIELVENEARIANSETITEVHLEVGQLAGVDLEALEFSLNMARQRTMMNHAVIRIDKIPGKAICKSCNFEFGTDALYSVCPGCNDGNTVLLSGMELKVKSLLVD